MRRRSGAKPEPPAPGRHFLFILSIIFYIILVKTFYLVYCNNR